MIVRENWSSTWLKPTGTAGVEWGWMVSIHSYSCLYRGCELLPLWWSGAQIPAGEGSKCYSSRTQCYLAWAWDGWAAFSRSVWAWGQTLFFLTISRFWFWEYRQSLSGGALSLPMLLKLDKCVLNVWKGHSHNCLVQVSAVPSHMPLRTPQTGSRERQLMDISGKRVAKGGTERASVSRNQETTPCGSQILYLYEERFSTLMLTIVAIK